MFVWFTCVTVLFFVLFFNTFYCACVRFDLIFLMLDPQDEAYDRRLASHLVSLYYQSEEQMEEEFLDMAVLRDYIAYARTYINPRLSEEASQALIEVCFVLLCLCFMLNICTKVCFVTHPQSFKCRATFVGRQPSADLVRLSLRPMWT